MTIRNLSALPRPASVAVIGAASRAGSTGAVVISAGITEARCLREKMLDAAKPYGLRIVRRVFPVEEAV